MKKLLIILSLSLIPLFAHSIFFKHIGTNEGLSQLSVMAIHQDQLGRMWFGTYEGISIYDGQKMISMKPVINPDHYPDLSGVIRDNSTFPIVEDSKRNIYLKVAYSLVKYDMLTQEFIPIVPDNVHGLNSIQGDIWFSSSNKVYRWNDDKNEKELILSTHIPFTINEIYRATNNTIWLGTGSGLYRKTNTDTAPVCVIPYKDISAIYESSHGDIWIGCRMEGMYRISRDGEITEFMHNPRNANSIISNQVRTFLEDKEGNMWIGTFEGLQKYEPSANRFTLYTRTKLPGSLSHPSVFSLFMDGQGTIWVGTYYGGVNYFNPESDIFTYYSDDPNRNDCLSYSFVGNMVEDRDGNVWICTEGGGLNKFDRKSRTFTHYIAGNNHNTVPHNNLKSIVYYEKEHCLYIGTHTGGIARFDIASSRFTNYLNNWQKSADRPHDIIYHLEQYNDSLFIMARNGLFGMDLKDQSVGRVFTQIQNVPLLGTYCKVDSKNRLWITQGNRLLRIQIDNPNEYTYFHHGENGLGSFQILSITETAAGDLYFASQGSGIYKYDESSESFNRYTLENGYLKSNYCYKICQSPHGYIIISGDNGLTLFDSVNGTVNNINLGANGLIISAMNAGCGLLVCKNGEVFVGGTDGMTTFFEDDLYKTIKPYNIYFSDLQISNTEILPGDDSDILSRAFSFTDQISLSHKQNNMIISFATNNYINMLNKSVYEYMLEGFDTEWIPTNKNSIYYTNLNPGKYTLRVREKNPAKNIVPQEIRLRVDIRTPLYATTWAYMLYIMFGLSIISAFIYFRYSKMRLKSSLETEKKEKEQIEELNQAKLRFFTNISHEFRTPLTLIISQIELLLQNSGLSPTVYNKILKVYRHTYQMRKLISELLDFRKFEQNHVTLNITENDVVSFMKEIYLNFYEYSVARQITYEFDAKTEPVHCWFDTVQMQKVIYNLLSNAFKYTRPQGVIEMIISEDDESVNIQIVDNGIGIEDKDINKVFERFYQVGKDSDSQQTSGTGIGLALTKSIVESHHGTLTVKSRPGYGSIFTVRLHKGNEHFLNDTKAKIILEKTTETVKPDTLPDPLFLDNMIESPTIPMNNDSKDDNYTILIVEDNEELLQTLQALFSPLYRVILARDGEEGLQKTLDEKPDLVLSDVMMPGMSGTEMCLRIKSNIDISHIPVVLLTALTSNEQNMEGLQRGADDYIGKPFNAKLLLVRCNNLIRNRHLLQNRYHNQADFDGKLLATNQLDLNFMEKVESVIKDNLDNPEFDVNKLAKEMALGRSTLFSKFKGLTGMTPNEFILNYKLKHASSLLRNYPDMQIADISDRLGFSSPRYFSRCFKAQYSVSPAEYRKGK